MNEEITIEIRECTDEEKESIEKIIEIFEQESNA